MIGGEIGYRHYRRDDIFDVDISAITLMGFTIISRYHLNFIMTVIVLKKEGDADLSRSLCHLGLVIIVTNDVKQFGAAPHRHGPLQHCHVECEWLLHQKDHL